MISKLDLSLVLYPPKSLKISFSLHKQSLVMQIEGLQRFKEELQAKSQQEIESIKTGTKFGNNFNFKSIFMLSIVLVRSALHCVLRFNTENSSNHCFKVMLLECCQRDV